MPFAPETRVDVEQLDATRWRVTRPIRYHGKVDTFEVPSGYITDFATVPRVAVWLIPRFGLYTAAAILHDRLLTDYLTAGAVTSTECDGLFRRVMRELGVPPVCRWLMWTGVRWGAAFSRTRRPGWARSAPAVLTISAAALPILGPPMILVAVALAVYNAAERIATGGRHGGNLTT